MKIVKFSIAAARTQGEWLRGSHKHTSTHKTHTDIHSATVYIPIIINFGRMSKMNIKATLRNPFAIAKRWVNRISPL